jgi:hypothetical protein
VTRLKFTGLSGGATAPAANGRPRDQRATRGQLQRSARCTGLFGVHRTVSSASSGPEEQWSGAPDLEGNRAPDCYNSCPVVHRTIRCTTRQKARLAFLVGLQRLRCYLQMGQMKYPRPRYAPFPFLLCFIFCFSFIYNSFESKF